MDVVSQYISLADCFVRFDTLYFLDGSGMNIILHQACAHRCTEFAMSTQGGSKNETTCEIRSGVVVNIIEN